MPVADVNGLHIEYEVDGTGEPLLMVAGLGMQLTGWPAIWVDEWVQRGFQVIRLDNRDIGLSSRVAKPAPPLRALLKAAVAPRLVDAPYRIDDLADDAVGVLDHLGVGRAHVIGVSMGGMISQALAIRHPDRVATLTSIMSNTGDRRNGRASLRLLLKLGRLLPRDGVATVENTVEVFRAISGPHFDADAAGVLVAAGVARSTDSLGTRRQLLAIAASPDRTPGLRQVQAPTLVIHGMLDHLVKPSGGVATARAVPGSRLLTFPDMAHDFPEHRLGEIVDAIHENIARAPIVAAAAT